MRKPLLFAALLIGASLTAQDHRVVATGAMRNTMFQGQLAGLIALDSVARPGVFGIGPMEFLRGELLVLDGIVYVSEATADGGMKVEQRSEARAPFFVHQQVDAWTTVEIPDGVVDLQTLDALLTERYATLGFPFAFRLSGKVREVHAHIVDVPLGAEVNGPDDAHRHNKDFTISDRQVDLVGFFSTKHKAVFTHHDTNIHVHAITAERDWMGHVEALRSQAGALTLQVALP